MARLDHVNVQTTRLADTVAFYRDVLGLEQRDPPGLDPKLVQWMHDEDGHALIHVSTVGSLLADGEGFREPFERIGAVRVRAPQPRRRVRGALRRRRPSILMRRKPGRPHGAPQVHRDEREIIARN